MQSKTLINHPVQFNENLVAAEGIFAISYRDIGYEDWTLFYEKKNLIVNSARKVMSHVVSGDENWYINQLRLGGKNTVNAQEMLNPTRPTVLDTNLVYTDNLFIRNSTDSVNGIPSWVVTYPNQPNETSVLFSVTIGRTEANLTGDQPTVYLSAGLFADSGNYLFSSQSFPVIAKTTERELLIEWNLRF